jgi:hypothetical protein
MTNGSMLRAGSIASMLAIALATSAITPATGAGARAAAGARFSAGFHTLNFPKSKETWIYGVSDGGELYGRYLDSAGIGHGFTYLGGVWTKINEPNAGRYGTIVVGSDTAGVLFGTYYNTFGALKGFLKTGTTYIKISDPKAVVQFNKGTYFAAVNEDGTSVGSYSTKSGAKGFEDVGGTTYTTITYKGGGGTPIQSTQVNGISSSGVMVGEEVSYTSTGAGFVLTSGKFTTVKVPGQTSFGETVLNGIAPTSGEMVGAARLSTSSHWGGFTLKAGKFKAIASHGVDGTLPMGVTDSGEVAGIVFDGNGLAHGFVLVP